MPSSSSLARRGVSLGAGLLALGLCSAPALGQSPGAPSVADLRNKPIFAQLPAFAANQAYDLPYLVQRGHFHETREMLNLVAQTFGRG